MEFGIRDLYDPDDRPRVDDDSLEQADDPTMKGKKRPRKSSKASYGRRTAKKADTRPADVAAESDY